MRTGCPAFAEELLDHRVADLFDPAWPPARCAILVDEHSAHAFKKIALFEAVRSHAEFHPETVSETQGRGAPQLAESHAHHRVRTAAHDLGGLPGPAGILAAGFPCARRGNTHDLGLRE